MVLIPSVLLINWIGSSTEPSKLTVAAQNNGPWTIAVGNTRAVGNATPDSIRIEVKAGNRWLPALGGVVSPFLQGNAKVVKIEDLPSGKTVTLTGETWSLRVAAERGKPSLKFTLVRSLNQQLTLPVGTVLAGMSAAANGVTSEQGPLSIYGGNVYGSGFPAAFHWNDGVESSVFFEVNATDWAGKTSVRRFLNSRVVAAKENSKNILGLATSSGNSTFQGPGDITFEWHVTARPNRQKPSRIEALARSVELNAKLHPQQTVTAPLPSWELFAAQQIKSLRQPGGFAEVSRPWTDGRLQLVAPFEKIITHPAHTGEQGGDFSTTNNNLSPAILFSRLQGEGEGNNPFRRQMDALPAFYDEKDAFICWSYEGHGPLAMSWQTIWFALESDRVAAAAPESWFNPSIKGRFLMGTKGLQQLARANNYAFPQWWDSTTKLAVPQNDLPQLGKVNEPWQAGQYSYVMLQAFETSGDQWQLDEAKLALSSLFEKVRYQVKNDLYEKSFSDPADFPVTELFGNGYGAVASFKLYAATKEPKYREYARYFLASMLRLTPWYEDESDPIACSLNSLGLFLPHGGAYNPTPWETTEANLSIAWVLANVPDAPYRELLLKLSNLNRINSFGFYPAQWPENVRKHSGKEALATPYLPIEPYYSFEAPGGHTGVPILYASTALWNYWLYDALATTDSPSVMALNLNPIDGFESALASADRRFLLYNPNNSSQKVLVRMKNLAHGQYEIGLQSARGQRVSTKASQTSLLSGTRLEIPAHSSVELRLRNIDRTEAKRIENQESAQRALASAYAALHQAPIERAMQLAEDFRRSLGLFRAKKYGDSKRIASQIRGAIRTE